MKVDADGKTAEYDQVQEWWYVHVDVQCWLLPMAVKGGLPMIVKKSAEVANWLMTVYRSVVGDSLMFSLVIRVRFVYGFHFIWNSSSSRVWL